MKNLEKKKFFLYYTYSEVIIQIGFWFDFRLSLSSFSINDVANLYCLQCINAKKKYIYIYIKCIFVIYSTPSGIAFNSLLSLLWQKPSAVILLNFFFFLYFQISLFLNIIKYRTIQQFYTCTLYILVLGKPVVIYVLFLVINKPNSCFSVLSISNICSFCYLQTSPLFIQNF